MRQKNIKWVTWTPELLRVRAYITHDARVNLTPVTYTLQSLTSAVAASKHDERWLVFDTSRSLKTRVGAYDMFSDPPMYFDPVPMPTGINLDVIIMHIITNQRQWRFGD